MVTAMPGSKPWLAVVVMVTTLKPLTTASVAAEIFT